MDERGRGALVEVLTRSRALGLLGPGPVEPQIDHARGFASQVERTPEAFLDLGTGGGLPGLVLAFAWPRSRGVLVDAMKRRAEFLRAACGDLGIDDRVEVVCERAEAAARWEALRGRFPVVTARSFAPPPVTAECGGAFLAVGGVLVVSEPPDDGPDDGPRWPAEGLETLGLAIERAATREARYVTLRRTVPVPEQFPRRTGVPMKRPLWR